MLFLKSLPANRLARTNFLWPDQVGAIVESTTWNPERICGSGLHGLINGEGDTGLLCHENDAVWYAFESVDEHGNPSDAETANIDDEKGKCHRAIIRAVGTRAEATEWLVRQGCKHVPYASIIADDMDIAVGKDSAVITGNSNSVELDEACRAIAGTGCNITANDGAVSLITHDDTILELNNADRAIVNNGAEITGEDSNQVVAKNKAVIKLRDYSDIICGRSGQIDSGDDSRVILGPHSVATLDRGSVGIAEYDSELTGSNHTTLVAGGKSSVLTENYGVAIVTGDSGKARCSYFGVAIANQNGLVAGDDGSVLVLRNKQYKPVVAIVGQNGIKRDTYYRLDDNDQFLEAPVP